MLGSLKNLQKDISPLNQHLGNILLSSKDYTIRIEVYLNEAIGYGLAVAVDERANHTELRCHLLHNLLHKMNPKRTYGEDLVT